MPVFLLRFFSAVLCVSAVSAILLSGLCDSTVCPNAEFAETQRTAE